MPNQIQVIPKALAYVGYGGVSGPSGTRINTVGVADGEGWVPFSDDRHIIPASGIFRRLVVYSAAARTGPLVVTFQVEGVSTALAVTLPTSASSAANLTVDIPVVAGSVVNYRLVGPTSFFPGYAVSVCVEFEATEEQVQIFGVAPDSGSVGVGQGWIAGALGNGLFSGYGGSPAPSNSHSICAINGSITMIALKAHSGAPGASNWTARLAKNGVLQDGTGGTPDTTAIITGSSTVSITFIEPLPVSQLDIVDVIVLRGGTSIAFHVQHVSVGIGFVPDIPGQFMLCGGSNHVIPNGGTTWKWTLSYQEGAAETMHLAPISSSGFTAIGLFIERGSVPAAGDSALHSLSRNGTPTTEIAALVDSTTGRLVFDLGEVPFVYGDLITIQIDNVGSPIVGGLHWGVGFWFTTIPEGESGTVSGVLGGTPGPLAWIHLPRPNPGAVSPDPAVITQTFSDQAMLCPPNWENGYKAPMVLRWGEAERALSHRTTGEWMGATFTVRIADPTLELREQLIDPNDRYWWNRPAVVKITSDDVRNILGTAFTIFTGPIVGIDPARSPELALELTLGDLVSQRLITDQNVQPWRLIRDGFLDQLTEKYDHLDPDAPEPIIYGTHRRVPTVDPASPQGFCLSPIYVGTEMVGGDLYHCWVVAGHACKDVPTIRVDDVEKIADEGTQWLVPHHAGWLAAFGTPYRDRTSSTYGDTRRYTLVYGLVTDMDASPDTMTDPDACATGFKQLTVAVDGIETAGDGTGELLEDLFDAYQDFAINYLANSGPSSYMGGPRLTNPTWDLFDGPVPMVDTTSFAACKAIAQLRLPGPGSGTGGYPVAAVIGARTGDRSSVRRWIAEWNRSGGCRFCVTRAGQIRISMIHPTALIKLSAPTFTDLNEIAAGSFQPGIALPQQANRIPFKGDYHHATGVWFTTGIATDDAEVDAYEREILGEQRDYPFAPGETMLNHLALMELRQFVHPPRPVVIEVPIGPDRQGESAAYLENGGYFNYQHFAAFATSRYEIRLALIEKIQVLAGPRRVRLMGFDVDDLIGFDIG